MTSPVELRGSLRHDKAVLGTGVLLLLAAIPLSTPLMRVEWRAAYGHYIVSLPFLVALIVGLCSRARAMTDETERRFWMLLTVGFLFWLSALLLDIPTGQLSENPLWATLNNLLYLLFYAATALALEIHPQVKSDSETGRLSALNRIGSFVFLFGLLMYFVLLPWFMSRGENAPFWASSLALFAALDGYLILRLFGLQQATPDAEWRAVFTWLLVGVAVWGLGDVALLLMYREVIPDPGYGSLFDIIRPLAFVLAFVGTRAGRFPPEARPDVHAIQEPLGMGPIIPYAIMMPLLHLLLYRFASSDPGMRPARELLVLGFTATLAALAFVYHRRLQIENRRLTEQEELSREKLAHLAFHDELTGLPNRDMFQDHLRLAMADAKRYGRKCAVLFCDLDRFKVINDSLGHEAGDQVLRSAADRLQSSVRELDTVARFGGDEFTIILQGLNSALDAARLAEKMLATLSEPGLVMGKRHVLTTSMGIAIFPDDGEDESTLLKHADIAMYQAKLQGRNTYRLFTEAMNEAAEERLAIEQGLRTTPMDENFEVFYQPIVGIATGEPMGYEALLRWCHPERGFVAPGSFLEVAEQSGLIVPIGQWVLETACKWALKMDSISESSPTIAVNMSARQLREPTFVKDVITVLERTGLAPSRLRLEISESILLDAETTAPILAALRTWGVHIAVDDFGTGFAALSRLSDFPIDMVKIDRSFVRGIEAGSVGETIVRAIVTMARALDFYVVAEGVETEAEFAVVSELCCDAVQGFYLQGPASAEEIEEALAPK